MEKSRKQLREKEKNKIGRGLGGKKERVTFWGFMQRNVRTSS